jgi:hypothetical protein
VLGHAIAWTARRFSRLTGARARATFLQELAGKPAFARRVEDMLSRYPRLSKATGQHKFSLSVSNTTPLRGFSRGLIRIDCSVSCPPMKPASTAAIRTTRDGPAGWQIPGEPARVRRGAAGRRLNRAVRRTGCSARRELVGSCQRDPHHGPTTLQEHLLCSRC